MLHAMIVSVASPGHFRGHCERTQNQAMGSASGPAGAEGSKRRAPLSAPVAQNLATERSMAEATGLEAAAKRASADAREDGPLQPHGAAADRQDSTADGPVQLHIHVQPVFLNISIQPTMPAYEYRLTLFPGEPEGVPKAVLRHLYTGALPDDPEQLIWVSNSARKDNREQQGLRAASDMYVRSNDFTALHVPTARGMCFQRACPLSTDAPAR